MMSNASKPLVHVTRGPLIECVHRGHIVVTDTIGSVLHSVGDPGYVTFARSAAKPIQALPLVESGAAGKFGLTEREIALLCASHNGEQIHTMAAASILGKIGLGESHLQCGAHPPFHRPTASAMRERGEKPTSLHNNCSGKHAGMLALAVSLGISPSGYLEPEHPVQQRMLEAVSGMSGIPSADIPIGIDGCGVPVFGLPISALATAYARLGSPAGLAADRASACRRITSAMAAHPEYVAGDDRFDTRLIRVTQGRILGKMGAEGVFAMSVPELGWGIAVKIEDGAQRALYPVAAEVLSQLGLVSGTELAALAEFHRPIHRNWQGTEVGAIAPVFQIS